MDTRSFVWGIMAGLVMLIVCLYGVSYIGGIKWQPVKVETLRGE